MCFILWVTKKIPFSCLSIWKLVNCRQLILKQVFSFLTRYSGTLVMQMWELFCQRPTCLISSCISPKWLLALNMQNPRMEKDRFAATFSCWMKTVGKITSSLWPLAATGTTQGGSCAYVFSSTRRAENMVSLGILVSFMMLSGNPFDVLLIIAHFGYWTSF